MITFIIPSIGRPTLANALASLYSQTDPDWNAIVCFDGVSPTIQSNDKIKVLYCDKQGNQNNYNSAGDVRNFAIKQATSEWIGLLDDDDVLSKDYVRTYKEEMSKTPSAKVISFKMQYTDGSILPPTDDEEELPFLQNRIGISFCFSRDVPIRFVQGSHEDYQFLMDCYRRGICIALSPKIMYYVLPIQKENHLEKDLRNFLNLNTSFGRTVFGIGECSWDKPFWSIRHKHDPDRPSIALGRSDILFFDWVLSHRDINRAVEFGTWVGLTSVYLGTSMRMKGGKFVTFDIEDKRCAESKKAWLDNMEFVKADFLQPEIPDFIPKEISQQKSLIFFDGGNKAKEVLRYAPFIAKGSGFMVHDWGAEISKNDISETLGKYEFVEQFDDIANLIGTHCRYFQRT